MNLYKALNDDYREFKLHESVGKTKRSSVRSRRNVRSKFKESTEVNVSNNGDSTDVNIVIDNKKADVAPVAPVVEEPVEEVTADVEEPAGELPLEEESDKKDCEGKDCEDIEEGCGSKDSIKESAEDGNKFWSSDFKVGDSLDSDGAGKVEILELDKGSDYILVKRESGYQPFVAAWAPGLTEDGKLYWGQGHYFDSEDSAKEYLADKKLSEADEDVEEVSDEEIVEVDPTTEAVSKLNEIIAIVDDEGSIDADKCKELVQGAIDILVPPVEEEVEVEEEPLEECEVKSFNILRMSPTGNLYMIEADKVDNSRVFIVGRNFNSKTNMLDEAEIFNDKDKATSKFRNVLYTVNNSKKGE